MKRWVLFTVTFTLVATLATAQAIVTPSGWATQAGAAVPVAPVSPPLVTTPIMHLGNAPTTPGTSAAAITASGTTPPSAIPIRPEISLGPETVYLGAPAAIEANTGANIATPTPTIAGRQLVELGVHSDAAVAFDDGTHGRSLGDIARENRQRMQNANAKTFTNADVQRLAGTGGVSGVVTSPGNTSYPSNNGVIDTNAVPGAVAAPTSPPTTEQNAPPATPPRRSPTQKPSAATPPH
jgi:hypothetical protein